MAKKVTKDSIDKLSTANDDEASQENKVLDTAGGGAVAKNEGREEFQAEFEFFDGEKKI